nr:hypothetical protein [Tanacetum cinerariifolium]
PIITIKAKIDVVDEIRKALTPIQRSIFEKTCFGHWLDVRLKKNSQLLIHTLLTCMVDGKANELSFIVLGNQTHFRRQEFCLVTGLRFGPNMYMREWVKNLTDNPFRNRMFPHIEAKHLVKLNDVMVIFDKMCDRSVYVEDNDAVKICLLVLLEQGFLGHQLSHNISDDKLKLVENLSNCWNIFPWGSYIWEYTYSQLRDGLHKRKVRHDAKREKGEKIQYTMTGFVWAFMTVSSLQGTITTLESQMLALENSLPLVNRRKLRVRRTPLKLKSPMRCYSRKMRCTIPPPASTTMPPVTTISVPMTTTKLLKDTKDMAKDVAKDTHLDAVIEFGNSYEAPKDVVDTCSASEGSAKKKGRTVTVTTEDMQKRRNDVKARTTLLLALPDEHQLRFNKYKAAQELWAAILKTFGGNEATKKTKKNQLKQQYGNFKAEAKNSSGNGEVNTASIPTASTQVSPASANVAAASISLDIACAYIASQSSGTNVAGFDKSKVKCFNCHNMGHFAKECRVPRSQDMGRRENFKQGSNVEESAPKALMAIDRVEAKLGEFKNQEIKFYKKIRGLEFKVESKTNRIKSLTNELKMLKKEKEGLDSKLTGYSAVHPPSAQVYSPPKKDMSWTGLPEFEDDTITDYSRPSPSIESKLNDLQNNSSSVSENGESTSSILSKPEIKFVKAADSLTVIKTSKDETVRKPSVKYVEVYRKPSKSSNVRVRTQFRVPRVPIVNRKFPTSNLKVSTTDLGNKGKAVKASACWIWKPKHNSTNKGPNSNSVSVMFKKYTYIDTQGMLKSDSGCSRHMTCNISYLLDYEPYDGGNVSFGQRGCKITGKGTIKTECIVLGRDIKLRDDTNVLLRTPRQHNMYSIDLNNIVPYKDLTCLVAKASIDESELWHRRLGHLNFKTMNRKQHKASCKTKVVNSVTKPLHTLHMALFGPTSTFFLKTKNETSGILRNFITEIENFKDLKVKIIRCDNGGEFRNREMNDFFSKKGIKREFSNAKTPQQNEVLVNKSQNKTPYELFNGRTPAICILKPFGCHVMILNSLDHLGKFEAKGDEGYFIRYSMSSKAFRVFNKRTKRVEENLHVEFLENKLIEKGAASNWLFDINTLTNSMNYVPVVSAGTTSTNFSGTKEAASQYVKKDVSSLRYIALPNWFHEAHLESSTSNAQDAYKADAPENSGNSNPTATSTNPPADQTETLTMETLILTVSSPVPTACLDVSLQLSSDTRLISKRVTGQVDTPSLDNILTLSNRFEDILGVIKNTGDSHGVEADLGNMEDNISTSPTPTFRIHKDHPTSQIISPMDTPNVWSLVDCPKGVRPIRTKWVLKNKKDERGIVIRNKARLVAQGYTQEEGIDYEEIFAPVARIKAIRLFLAYASFMGFTVYQMDVKSAFIYGTIDEEVYVMQPPGFQDLEFPARVYKVEKAMYGLHQAPRAWSANTLMDKENPWGKDETGKDVNLYLYRSMIGSLMYLTASRPNIMFAVCACARHQVTPKECHMHAVKRIFRYLKGHPKLGNQVNVNDFRDCTPPMEECVGRINSPVADFEPVFISRKARRRRVHKSVNSWSLFCILPLSAAREVTLGVESLGKVEQDEMVSKITAQDLEISQLKARIKLLEDKDGGANAPSREDALIKGRVWRQGRKQVPTLSIPPAGEVRTGSSVVPTASPIFTTATSSALPTVANEPTSPLGDDSQGEACLTVSGFEAE